MPQPPPQAMEAARRLILGEAGAFEDLVRIYSPRLRKGWARPNPCKFEPEDFVQETWLRCLMNFRRLRRPEDVEQWIVEAASYAQVYSPAQDIVLMGADHGPRSLSAALISMR